MKQLSTNIQVFRHLVEKNCIYVDKTEQIYNLIQSVENKYFLARPRRFGKSLLVSTFVEIFSGNKELFKDYWIGKSDYSWVSHPVIHLDLSIISIKSVDIFEEDLQKRLVEIGREYEIDLTSEKTVSAALRELVIHLSKQYPVVLLIDEYDSPILSNLNNIDVALEIRDFLSQLFKVVKGLEEYLRFVFITGVSKFSKTSVFSGLNNLFDLTLSTKGATLLGYTKEELLFYFDNQLKQLATNKQMRKEDLIQEMEYWYNGYRFTESKATVFAPYSILLFLRSGHFRNHWFETATPSFLIHLLQSKNYSLRQINEPSVQINDLGSFDIDNIPLTTLLFQTGYLTIKNYNESEDRFLLDYPNYEVEQSLLSSIASYCSSFAIGDIQSTVKGILQSLQQNNIEEFLQSLQQFFSEIPYTVQIKNEKEFQLIIYSLGKLLGLDIETEVATSHGSIDLTLSLKNTIYIIELKFDKSAQEAIDQIYTRKYFQKYVSQNKKIILVGVNFNLKERTLSSDWIIKNL